MLKGQIEEISSPDNTVYKVICEYWEDLSFDDLFWALRVACSLHDKTPHPRTRRYLQCSSDVTLWHFSLFFFWTANRTHDFMLSRMKSRLHRESGQSTLPSIPQGLTSVNTELSEITSRFFRVVGHNMAVFTPFYEDILVEIKSSLDWYSVTSAFWWHNRYIFSGSASFGVLHSAKTFFGTVFLTMHTSCRIQQVSNTIAVEGIFRMFWRWNLKEKAKSFIPSEFKSCNIYIFII